MKTKRVRKIFIFFLLYAILISACGMDESLLAMNREKWANAGIHSYEVRVQHIQSIWHAQEYTITVENGTISHSARCIPAPAEGKECEVTSYDPQDFTIEGLFRTAEWALNSIHSDHVKIIYNTELGYPEHISLDDPDILDEDNAWAVRDFSTE